MTRLYIIILASLFAVLINCCSAQRNDDVISGIRRENLNLLDKSRDRLIPVALYIPDDETGKSKFPVVIFSHGYGANAKSSNTAYSYLTNRLAAKGYFVASIQHELVDDELLPASGDPRIVRMPNWERGVKNILFVIDELKKEKTYADYNDITLIGHSNGGDMSMLFAEKYPAYIKKVISLDNRRMPLPRTNNPKIYSLRSSDQSADEGVLPSADEQKKSDIEIVKLDNTAHNEMDDSGSELQHDEIVKYILRFLSE